MKRQNFILPKIYDYQGDFSPQYTMAV